MASEEIFNVSEEEMLKMSDQELVSLRDRLDAKLVYQSTMAGTLEQSVRQNDRIVAKRSQVWHSTHHH